MRKDMRSSIGILGGTFDPIHIGHLRSALEVKENLQLDEMRLIPVYLPSHRKPPIATPEDRLNMVRYGISDTELSVDNREILRKGPSYTVDTLISFREEFPDHSISMVLGTDAFFKLPTWHQWERILELCNIIVIHRSGWEMNEKQMSASSASKVMAELLEKFHLKENEDLREYQHGRIQTQKITLLEVSGQALRGMIAKGASPRYLIPENVLKYIAENRLYGYNSVSISETQKGGK